MGAWRLEVALRRRPFRAAILVARGGQFSGPGARYTSLQGLNEAFWWCSERITTQKASVSTTGRGKDKEVFPLPANFLNFAANFLNFEWWL